MAIDKKQKFARDLAQKNILAWYDKFEFKFEWIL